MKLIMCRRCHDIVRLRSFKKRCSCGRAWGQYTGAVLAIYGGVGTIPLGITNDSLEDAIAAQPEVGNGRLFTAFVIPRKCYTMEFVSEDSNQHAVGDGGHSKDEPSKGAN